PVRHRELRRRLDPGGRLLVDLLLLRERVHLAREIAGLDPRSRDRLRERVAEPVRVDREHRHLGEVVLVRGRLARAGAALNPEDEQDDDQDPEGDQARETRRRRDAARPLARRWRAARLAMRPRTAGSGRALTRLRLVEEVELDVGVVLAHDAAAGRGRKSTLPSFCARKRVVLLAAAKATAPDSLVRRDKNKAAPKFSRAGLSPVGAKSGYGCPGPPLALRPAPSS